MRTLTSVGWIHVRDERLLAVRTSGRDRFYLPGGKPEADETFEAALIREVREELGLAIDGVGFAFTVSATAHGFDDATVIMHCFHGDPRGEPQAGREITELAWLGVAERDLAAPAVQLVLDRLAGIGAIR